MQQHKLTLMSSRFPGLTSYQAKKYSLTARRQADRIKEKTGKIIFYSSLFILAGATITTATLRIYFLTK